MESIEEKILCYSQLPPEERRAVERYVDANPAWAPLLEEAKALERLFREAALFYRQPLEDEVIAYYVASQYVHHHDPPPPLRAVFDRLAQHIAHDAALEGRYRTFEKRLQEIEARSDAGAQFERLAGYRLEASPGEVPGRAARIYPLYAQAVRWAAAAAVLLVVVYGGLFLASRATQPELHRLAGFHPQELEVEGYEVRTRSGAALPEAASADALYLRALVHLQQARSTFLGLFPRYDAERLSEAAALLEETMDREDETPASFLRLEAAYLLGKVRLLQGDVAGGRAALRAVVNNQGRRAPEAAAILRALPEAEAP